MCEINIYPRSDGTGRPHRRIRPCRDSHDGETCANTTIYKHSTPAPVSTVRASHLPPSPRLTPGSSPRMGYSPRASPRMDSPRTSHHDSDSETSHRYLRPHVHVPHASPRRESSHRRHRSHDSHRSSDSHRSHDSYRHGERVVIIEHPPTARTPPQRYAIPRTAPSSPSPAHESLRHQPVIVDERERPQRRVRISDPLSPEPSEGSSSSPSRRRRRDDEHRRREREREREEAEAEVRIRRREARIAQANRRISTRPEQPLPQRASTAYARPTVEVPSHGAGLGLAPEDEITEGMWRMEMEDMDEEEEEEEAQRRRLKERMMPRRRATIGAGSRRSRVQFPDGMYQME